MTRKDLASPSPATSAALRKRRVKKAAPAVKIPDFHGEWPAEHVCEIQRHLLRRLNGIQQPVELIGQDHTLSTLSKLLGATLTEGENNSILMVGPRGCGKSTILRRSLVNVDPNGQFTQVWLNGLLHTDDRLVLETIVRDLNLDGRIRVSEFGSFASCFNRIFELLLVQDDAKIVFVLEEFDMFTEHAKQALLYNLFDAVQHCRNSIAVIGLTCRQDVLSMLEKRVKSRFSHRVLELVPAESLQAFGDVAKQFLILDPEYCKIPGDYLRFFNTSISGLFADELFLQIVNDFYRLFESVKAFSVVLKGAVLQLSPQSPLLSIDALTSTTRHQLCDAKARQLTTLTSLELSLMMAMTDLQATSMREYNFEMIYKQYRSTAVLKNIAQKRAVALKAFDNLFTNDVIAMSDGISKCPKEFRMVRLTIDTEMVKSEWDRRSK